jgi:hypothetical protein
MNTNQQNYCVTEAKRFINDLQTLLPFKTTAKWQNDMAGLLATHIAGIIIDAMMDSEVSKQATEYINQIHDKNNGNN